MVVEDGNGRPDTVAAMLRKRNRPVITRMNRTGFQSPCGVLGVCRKATETALIAQFEAGFSPLAGF